MRFFRLVSEMFYDKTPSSEQKSIKITNIYSFPRLAIKINYFQGTFLPIKNDCYISESEIT